MERLKALEAAQVIIKAARMEAWDKSAGAYDFLLNVSKYLDQQNIVAFNEAFRGDLEAIDA